MTAPAPKLQFRPRARIIRTIGDQLISGPEAAVIELVKNAYDADASYVWIKFYPPLSEGDGRLVVVDDGHGMTLNDVAQKWMEPATSSKVQTRRSPKKRRIMMGSKGIGRFAAGKLGRRMALRSVSERTGVRTEVLIPEIDWSVFSSDRYLSDIEIDYLEQVTDSASGTEIEIREFNEAWTEAKLLQLSNELRRLISPLAPSKEEPFRIYLDLSELTLAGAGIDGMALLQISPDDKGLDERPPPPFEVKPFPLLTSSDYEVTGRFDPAGRFTGTMEIRRSGRSSKSINDLLVPLADDEQPCGTVGVHLYIYDREAAAVQQTMTRAGISGISTAEAREVLDKIAGVSIYRHDFRVRPYGDPENDWLTLDKRRVQNPSLRIGHDQIAGYVNVEDEVLSGLIERSSREGFEQNSAFKRLARLIEELLAKTVEPRRFKYREESGISRRPKTTFQEARELSSLPKIRALVTELPAAKQQAAAEIIAKESAQLAEKIAALEERQRVLEAKSSLGAIISEVLHEGGPAVAYIATASGRLQKLYVDLNSGGDKAVEAREQFPDRLANIKTNSIKLSELFAALRPLAGGKRGRPEYFRPIEPISSAIKLFEMHDAKITVTGGYDAPEIIGFKDDLHTAMVNLLGNAIYWLEDSKTPDPTVEIRILTQGADLVVIVEDNGPGISDEYAEHIFEVGFSRKNDGTGLGLNIAREALARSDGRLAYHVNYKDGARFEIRFPLSKKGGS